MKRIHYKLYFHFPYKVCWCLQCCNCCLLSPSVKTTVKTEKKGQQAVLKLSPLPKRAKRTYLAMDTDKEVIGYVIPVFRAK